MKQAKETTMKAVIAMALQVGISTSVSAIVFILGGLWLDRRWGTIPLFTLIGAALGLVVALYLVWQIVRPLQKMK
jgi:hypothetical protein